MRAPLSALKVGLVQPSIDGSTDSLVAITSLLEVKAFGFSKDTDFREISRFSMIATYRGPDIWIVSMKLIKITRSSNHPIFTIGCLINGGDGINLKRLISGKGSLNEFGEAWNI